MLRALPPLNPVLARELKQRMRGRLTWLVVTGYLAVLALILRFVYLGASQTLGGADFGDPLASATVGPVDLPLAAVLHADAGVLHRPRAHRVGHLRRAGAPDPRVACR